MGDRMKKIAVVIAVVLAASLTACAPTAAPTPLPTVVLNVNPSAASSGVSASGVVVPATNAALSFPLTGTVKTVEVKAGDKVSKGQTLVALDTAVWDAQVRQAEAALVAAQANVNFLIRNGTDQDHLQAANSDVDRAQANLDAAKATVAQATLVAPFDGTIASVDISPAETVVPGQELIMLGDLSNFQVETTDLSERDAPAVQVGQAATVSVTALNQQFPGKVIDISRISSTVGGDVVYKVTVQLESQPGGLLWGMTTDVDIATK